MTYNHVAVHHAESRWIAVNMISLWPMDHDVWCINSCIYGLHEIACKLSGPHSDILLRTRRGTGFGVQTHVIIIPDQQITALGKNRTLFEATPF